MLGVQFPEGSGSHCELFWLCARTLKQGGRGSSGGASTRSSASFVGAEMPRGLILLMGAGLMVRESSAVEKR